MSTEFCSKCGTAVQPDKKFCAACGQPVAAGATPGPQQPQSPQQPYPQQPQPYQPQQYQQQPQYQQQSQYQRPDGQGTEEFDPADIEQNKTMAGLAYFLFFLPLVACPQSRFGRFHANQGLVLLILSVGGSIILSIIPIIGWILLFVFPIFIVVLGIKGLLNGLNGRVKELPIIGKFRIIK